MKNVSNDLPPPDDRNILSIIITKPEVDRYKRYRKSRWVMELIRTLNRMKISYFPTGFSFKIIYRDPNVARKKRFQTFAPAAILRLEDEKYAILYFLSVNVPLRLSYASPPRWILDRYPSLGLHPTIDTYEYEIKISVWLNKSGLDKKIKMV
jgi:hypothetical protein